MHFRTGPIIIVLGVVLSACSPGGAGNPLDPVEPTPSQADAPPTATAFEPVRDTPTPDVLTIWISPALPEPLQQSANALEGTGARPIQRVTDPEAAMVRLEPGPEMPLSTWIYALAAPFPTIVDDLSADDLRAAWVGQGQVDTSIYASATTALALQTGLGEPTGVIQGDGSALLEAAWETRPSLAVVPFDALEPRWKVLRVDGQSPIAKGFEREAYPLTVEFGLSGDPQAAAELASVLGWPSSNRDPDRLTVLVMTGVTALTRATAWMMEQRGVNSPAEQIGDWLSEADFTHISNEVSFSETCPRPPDPSPANTRFCSLPDHIELLETIGVDLVELTGNHVMDWGADAFRYSIELYDQRGWSTFGGGLNREDSLQPVLLEHNGNRLAFLGCNPAGPFYAWAGENTPGSAPCDNPRLFGELSRLRSEGYITIFTYQWAESYRAWPLPAQIEAFREAVDAGALIVSGSQAHQPQGFEFYGDGFIHYGPGNLFFDQMWSLQTRQEFVDRYVIYAGRHISTELLTAMLEDWSRPRPMTPEERSAFLDTIFQASGW